MIGLGIGIPFSRSSGGGSGFDPAAKAYFDAVVSAGGSLSALEKTAYNTFVLAAKSKGYYSKFKALYPVLGGSASSCKFNSIDPRNLDAAYRLSFLGGWTFSATGMQGNGINGTADTFLNPFSVLTSTSLHMMFYSRTIDGNTNFDVCAGGLFFVGNFGGTFYIDFETGGGYGASASTNSQGFHLGSRINGTNVNGYKNAAKVINNFPQSAALQNSNVFIASRGGSGFESSREYAGVSIGDGFTDTDASNYYTDFQAMQTTLGRNV